jgi:transcriptional regulator with XRE-family HTH domain
MNLLPPPAQPSAESFRDLLCGNEEREGLLEFHRLSVEQLAVRANLTRAAVYYYFNGRTRPSPNSLAAICNVLGFPYAEALKYITPRVPGRKKKAD